MELAPIKHVSQLRFQPGDRAGTFTIVRALGSKHFGRGVAVVFLVRCDCGAETERYRQSLIKKPSSCEHCRTIWTQPKGSTRHPLQKRYAAMIDRCTNPANADWRNYGGRGISVCQSWITGRDGMTGFETFCVDMGHCPDGGTIERIDNSSGYSPDNCRWAPKSEQSRNRRCARNLTWNGETLGLAQWAERQGIPYFTLMRRVKLGWTTERALTEPLRALRTRPT